MRNLALENTVPSKRTLAQRQTHILVEDKDGTCASDDEHAVVEVKQSRLTSTGFIQIKCVDHSHALLYIKYGDKYLAMLQSPKWFGEAIVKPSESNVLDLAEVLISIRHEKACLRHYILLTCLVLQ